MHAHVRSSGEIWTNCVTIFWVKFASPVLDGAQCWHRWTVESIMTTSLTCLFLSCTFFQWNIPGEHVCTNLPVCYRIPFVVQVSRWVDCAVLANFMGRKCVSALTVLSRARDSLLLAVYRLHARCLYMYIPRPCVYCAFLSSYYWGCGPLLCLDSVTWKPSTVTDTHKSQQLEATLNLRRLVAGNSSWGPGFSPVSFHVGFVVDEVALSEICLRVLRCFPANIIPPVLQTCIWYIHDRGV